MTFEQYCEIMQNHGIGELFFRYSDKEYSVFTEVGDLDISYSVSGEGVGYASFYDFEEMISAKRFQGRTLQEIWSELEIVAIDGVKESEYNCEEFSFNYVKWKEARGKLQWRYFAGSRESFFYQFKFVLLGVLFLPVLSIIFPLLKLSNWNILILTGGCAVIALIIALIVLSRNRIILNYTVTDKRIIVFKGISCETTYENVKRIKLKKRSSKAGYCSIKIYVKKGLSINYHMENIPDAEKVYAILSENIEKSRM